MKTPLEFLASIGSFDFSQLARSAIELRDAEHAAESKAREEAMQAQIELLAEARRLRPKVMAFAQIMERKLEENDWKGGWERCTPKSLIKRLHQEAEELEDIVARRKEGGLERGIGGEAADVANFAMMVADVCGALEVAAPSPPESTGAQPCPCKHCDVIREAAPPDDIRVDLAEALENIERMKVRYAEIDAELERTKKERDDWRQQRVDIGVKYDLFAARHKGHGCGRRETDAPAAPQEQAGHAGIPHCSDDEPCCGCEAGSGCLQDLWQRAFAAGKSSGGGA